MSRSEFTRKSPASISIHWNIARLVSIRVGKIKNKMTTFEATKSRLNSIKLDFEINAIMPKIIEIITQSIIGAIAVINILKIVGDGVNSVNSEFDDSQSNENTVVVPDPSTFKGVNKSLTVVGRFMLYASTDVISCT